jgi:large repetitive protein
VTVIAEDGKLTTRHTITVVVENTNRAPTLRLDQQLFELTEGETLRVRATVNDPDGDEVTITYGEPLNSDGIWVTSLDDEGEYTVIVSATDGTATVRAEAQVTVLRANRAPVIEVIGGGSELRFAEGDLIDLSKAVTVTDEEGDDVTVRYSGWMNTAVYQTNYEDSGTHTVIVSATDSAGNTASKALTIYVANTNRPPVFTRPA